MKLRFQYKESTPDKFYEWHRWRHSSSDRGQRFVPKSGRLTPTDKYLEFVRQLVKKGYPDGVIP